MKAPLFNDILTISQAIADSSGKGDESARAEHYQQLIKLCAANENSPKDHPLQWEALADFTNDSEQALDIYEKALHCAERLALVDFTASIYLSMAQRYEEMELVDKAREIADKSLALVEQVENKELCADIVDYAKNLASC